MSRPFRALRRQLRFRRLMLEERFLEALALEQDGPLGSIEDRARALHRLGCYRSVVALDCRPRAASAVVAVAASLAACGEPGRAEDLLRPALRDGRLDGWPANWLPRIWLRERQRIRAARALAPFHVALALELAQGLESRPGLVVALLLANGRTDAARPVIAAALAAGAAKSEPDLYLWRANTIAEPRTILELLNRYLDALALSPVVTGDDALPPTPGHLRGTLPAGTVRGPLVSVIMPAFETEDRIGSAIGSVLAQTYRDLEVLVVDDASRDGTVDAAAAWAARDERVRVFRLEQNGGPYVARNLALAQARGVFVTCHDSDDWAHPERIARQVQPLLASERLVFTTSKWVRVQDDGRFYARPVYPLARLNPASPLFRREPVLARLGGWEEVRTGADTEHLARLKLAFGRSAGRSLTRTLTLGAHRPGSLMTDPRTGAPTGPMHPERLAYWEGWVVAHLAAMRAGEELPVHPLREHCRPSDSQEPPETSMVSGVDLPNRQM